jgi:hypothetical protein
MTQSTNKFEQLLELLINEENDKAQALFHEIVVEKSRDIYEGLAETETKEDSKEEVKETEKAEVTAETVKETEKTDSKDESVDETVEIEEESIEEVGGDATDDLIGDISADEKGDAEHGDDANGDEPAADDQADAGIENKIVDLEDALEELKAEFEQLMAGEEGEPEMGGDDMGMDAEPEMDGGMGMDAEEPVDELQRFMEYVDKVSLPKHGDNGANTKSIVAGKNDMGGTAKNLNQAGTEKSPVEANKGELRGTGVFKGSKPQLQDGGNINKPGGNAGKTAFKKKEPGHGAEKKGTGDNGANTNSPINGAPGRAK